MSTASMQDKITYYKKAIALNPEAEDAWLGLVNAVGEDTNLPPKRTATFFLY
ncbi:MAG: hypothetical protein ACLVAT_05290 [Lachnospiraceae bacterium]